MTKLDLVEEIKEKAKVSLKKYKRKIAKYHNARVKHKNFKKGDSVLKKIEVIG